jgi:FAD/FMN-containing dehydrogenase
MDKQPIPNQVSLREKLSAIYDAGREDFYNSSAMGRLTLAATVGGLGFEWSTGNEALLGTAGGNLHQMSDNALITGAGTGAVSFVEQGTFGILMAATIANYPRVAESIRCALPSRDNQQSDLEQSDRSKTNRFLSAFMFGAAAELAIANAEKPRTRSENVKRALGSSAMIGGGVAVLTTTVSGMAILGNKYGMEQQTDVFVDIVSNPLTYAGLFASKLGYDKVKKRMQNRAQRRQAAGGVE